LPGASSTTPTAGSSTRLFAASWRYVTGEPPLWFHEVFRADGSAYRADEVDFIRSICLKNG